MQAKHSTWHTVSTLEVLAVINIIIILCFCPTNLSLLPSPLMSWLSFLLYLFILSLPAIYSPCP